MTNILFMNNIYSLEGALFVSLFIVCQSLLICFLLDILKGRWPPKEETKETTYVGTNTLWKSMRADKIYLTSGKFTSVIKCSEDVTRDIDTFWGPPETEEEQEDVVLVPIIVKISVINGRYYYPNFDEIPADLRDNQSWRKSPGGLGAQWMLSPSGPDGTIYGALKIPEPTAQAAVDLLPDDVRILTEIEWEEMCDTHKNKRHYE